VNIYGRPCHNWPRAHMRFGHQVDRGGETYYHRRKWTQLRMINHTPYNTHFFQQRTISSALNTLSIVKLPTLTEVGKKWPRYRFVKVLNCCKNMSLVIHTLNNHGDWITNYRCECVKNKKKKSELGLGNSFLQIAGCIVINLIRVTAGRSNQFYWMVRKSFARTNSHLFALSCHLGLQWRMN
jgi:hypothetical protein